MKKKGKIVLFVIVGVLIVLVGAGRLLRDGAMEKNGRPSLPSRDAEKKGRPSFSPPSRGSQVQTTVFPVTTTIAEVGQIEDYIKVNGDVVAETTVYVFPDISGKVTNIAVRVGDYVRKGQTVAMIDPSTPGNKYLENPVTTPISGTVLAVEVDMGKSVSPTIPIVEIGSLDNLQVEVNVPERFIGSISVGSKAQLSFDAYSGLSFDAWVIEMSPVLDTTSRTLQIKLDFQDSKNLVRAGMFASIKLITDERDSAIAIPADSVVSRDGSSVVFVVADDNTAKKRSVTTGIRIDGILEIKEGIQPGESVVIMGQTRLEDGAEVKVIQSETGDGSDGQEGQL
jgi:multidrug efflux pump subunit AcrA (membrane-fusion protein)